jgi:hypothetical protein
MKELKSIKVEEVTGGVAPLVYVAVVAVIAFASSKAH